MCTWVCMHGTNLWEISFHVDAHYKIPGQNYLYPNQNQGTISIRCLNLHSANVPERHNNNYGEEQSSLIIMCWEFYVILREKTLK